MGIDRQAFAESIRHLGAEYIAQGRAASLYDVNDGSCEEFANDLVEAFGGEREGLESWWADNLSVDGRGEEWDVALVERLFPATCPTHGLDWDDVRFAIPAHCWVEMGGRHYDAECPEGADNLFEVPLFRRLMERVAAERAAPAP